MKNVKDGKIPKTLWRALQSSIFLWYFFGSLPTPRRYRCQSWWPARWYWNYFRWPTSMRDHRDNVSASIWTLFWWLKFRFRSQFDCIISPSDWVLKPNSSFGGYSCSSYRTSGFRRGKGIIQFYLKRNYNSGIEASRPLYLKCILELS